MYNKNTLITVKIYKKCISQSRLLSPYFRTFVPNALIV